MSEPTNNPYDPNLTTAQLMELSYVGRVYRLFNAGMSVKDAIMEVHKPETPDAYAARNKAAIDALTERLLSPEYQKKFDAAHAIQDGKKKAEALAQLKRENFESIDMEAVYRHIRANNRRAVAEGMFEPDAKI